MTDSSERKIVSWAAELRTEYQAIVAQVSETSRELNALSRMRARAAAAPTVLAHNPAIGRIEPK